MTARGFPQPPSRKEVDRSRGDTEILPCPMDDLPTREDVRRAVVNVPIPGTELELVAGSSAAKEIAAIELHLLRRTLLPEGPDILLQDAI